MRTAGIIACFATALFAPTNNASAQGFQSLTAQKIDDETILVSGSVPVTTSCMSFVSFDDTAPASAPEFRRSAIVVTRLSHSGDENCYFVGGSVPVELEIARPFVHPADRGPEFVVHYTISEGAPESPISRDGLVGEIIVVQEEQ